MLNGLKDGRKLGFLKGIRKNKSEISLTSPDVILYNGNILSKTLKT